MSTKDYRVIIHPDEAGGYWTEVPSLPGCGSQGETLEEAIEMTKDAIEAFLASLKQHGESVPDEATVVVTVTVAA
jgi:predicted RNase H-like HicB family nuclease